MNCMFVMSIHALLHSPCVSIDDGELQLHVLPTIDEGWFPFPEPPRRSAGGG